MKSHSHHNKVSGSKNIIGKHAVGNSVNGHSNHIGKRTVGNKVSGHRNKVVSSGNVVKGYGNYVA